MQNDYYVTLSDSIDPEIEKILQKGIRAHAIEQKKVHHYVKEFEVVLKDKLENVVGGAIGVTYYGCLYIDTLWIASDLRGKGFGTTLMGYAEQIGKDRSCSFTTVTTMDWEALPFYQKLGYEVEFIREGYENGSKMFILRKNL